MISKLFELKEHIDKGIIEVQNQKANNIITNYTFYEVSETFNSDKYPQVFQNLIESKIIIINQSNAINKKDESIFFIVCFKNTILVIKQDSLIFLKKLFSNIKYQAIYFLNDKIDAFRQIFKEEIKILKADTKFVEEIMNFTKEFILCSQIDPILMRIWLDVAQSISGYIIKQSYEKSNKSQFEIFLKPQPEVWDVSDYVELRMLGCSSFSNVYLIYNFNKDELFAIKKRDLINNPEQEKLVKREIENCSILNNNFFINKYYGYVKDYNYLIFEFINGKTLENIKNLHLSISEKTIIIFELLIAFQSIYINKMIYRDLKPNNVMIDQEKTAVLIDFDRLIQLSDNSNSDQNKTESKFTTDFASDFVAPEVADGKCSLKSDIYSLGLMIYYL